MCCLIVCLCVVLFLFGFDVTIECRFVVVVSLCGLCLFFIVICIVCCLFCMCVCLCLFVCVCLFDCVF